MPLQASDNRATTRAVLLETGVTAYGQKSRGFALNRKESFQ